MKITEMFDMICNKVIQYKESFGIFNTHTLKRKLQNYLKNKIICGLRRKYLLRHICVINVLLI